MSIAGGSSQSECAAIRAAQLIYEEAGSVFRQADFHGRTERAERIVAATEARRPWNAWRPVGQTWPANRQCSHDQWIAMKTLATRTTFALIAEFVTRGVALAIAGIALLSIRATAIGRAIGREGTLTGARVANVLRAVVVVVATVVRSAIERIGAGTGIAANVVRARIVVVAIPHVRLARATHTVIAAGVPAWTVGAYVGADMTDAALAASGAFII